MATVKDLRRWMVRDLLRPNIQIRSHPEASSDETYFRAFIFTATNKYSIVGIERHNGGTSYLGCIGGYRSERPGETWNRGNDLPDGSLSKKTWRKILAGIVRYEAQRISQDCEDNENPTKR